MSTTTLLDLKCRVTDDYVFFWRGPFSQWPKFSFHYESFVYQWLKSQIPPTVVGTRVVERMDQSGGAVHPYNCPEQAMMAKKARLFGDFEQLGAIMKSTSAREQKELGRAVRDFVKDDWDRHAREIVYRINLAKFEQNQELRDIMLAQGERMFVEASPVDCIWGIGMAENDPGVEDRRNWKGTNWLGEALTRVKETLRQKMPASPKGS
jgi:ribA/ribD-fused uncharacterized protein